MAFVPRGPVASVTWQDMAIATNVNRLPFFSIYLFCFKYFDPIHGNEGKIDLPIDESSHSGNLSHQEFKSVDSNQ